MILIGKGLTQLDKVQALKYHSLKVLRGFCCSIHSWGMLTLAVGVLSQWQPHIQLCSSPALKCNPEEVGTMANRIYNIV